MATEQQIHLYGDSSDSGEDFCMEERMSPQGSPVPSETTLCFEGPEKNLEMQFKISTLDGCRAMTREMLDDICSKAQCCILSKKCNVHFDAYILSESSLFVFRDRIVMKTCGTTTLLRCVTSILSYANLLGLDLLRVLYSRKNFTFPEAQQFPHGSFEEEWNILDRVLAKASSMQSQKGGAFIVGPLHEDHWLTYVHESTLAKIPTPVCFGTGFNRAILNVMMFDLDRKVAQLFYRNSYSSSLSGDEVANLQTEKSGIANIIPSSSIDAHAFEPCGYSMNGIHDDMYQTIHITPEEEGSYASFEATFHYGPGSNPRSSGVPSLDSEDAVRKHCLQIIRKVVTIFKPQRFMLTVTDCNVTRGKLDINVLEIFDEIRLLPEDSGRSYDKSFTSLTQMRPSIGCHVSNWRVPAPQT